MVSFLGGLEMRSGWEAVTQVGCPSISPILPAPGNGCCGASICVPVGTDGSRAADCVWGMD